MAPFYQIILRILSPLVPAASAWRVAMLVTNFWGRDELRGVGAEVEFLSNLICQCYTTSALLFLVRARGERESALCVGRKCCDAKCRYGDGPYFWYVDAPGSALVPLAGRYPMRK